MVVSYHARAKEFLDPPDDLTQLRLINAKDVQALAEEINRLDIAAEQSKKVVILLATGGTVAMQTSECGVRSPSHRCEKLLAPVLGLLQDRYSIFGLNAFCIDSSQMNYSHVRELAIVMTYLWHNVKTPHLGFLITHGTDTMSYVGAALSLMTGPGLPFSIVLTGSQRPMDAPMSDAPINIRNALCTLESLRAKDMAEVVIVMGDKAILATSSEKVGASIANAFDAPRHRYVARFNQMEYPVPLARWLNPRRKVPFAPTIWQENYSGTLVIKSILGLDPEMLAAQIQSSSVRSILLYSYGSGTVDEVILRVIVDCCRREDKPVFIVNPLNSDYKTEYESAANAIRNGIVPLNMTLSAAMAKLEIAMRLHDGDVEAISKFMTENYVGEIPTEITGAPN
jgi:L-asparaginase